MTTWIFIGGVLIVGLIAGAGLALIYVDALSRNGDDHGQPDGD